MTRVGSQRHRKKEEEKCTYIHTNTYTYMYIHTHTYMFMDHKQRTVLAHLRHAMYIRHQKLISQEWHTVLHSTSNFIR